MKYVRERLEVMEREAIEGAPERAPHDEGERWNCGDDDDDLGWEVRESRLFFGFS